MQCSVVLCSVVEGSGMSCSVVECSAGVVAVVLECSVM